VNDTDTYFRRRPLSGALGVLLHHLLKEAGDVVEPAVLGVPHVLAVVMASLERVVLH
jgi:hypothetical protein